MIKKVYLVILLGITVYTTQGQNFTKEFGVIGKEEIELNEYALNKDAEAVVLFDIAKSYFVQTDNSFDIVFERSTRIKVLSESGIKWAEVEIPIYQEGGIYENVYDIEAYSYNYENGRINKTTLDVSNTYDEKINNYWNVRKFAIPKVKKGSIIEYKYKINSQYKFNLRDWEFQWKIPVVYSEYEVKMIPFYQYTWLLQGASKFYSQESYVSRGLPKRFGSITFQDMVHNFIMKDIPAFENEEFITSVNDYIIKIDFQLSKIIYPNGSSVDIITTWEDMVNELLKHKDFGKYIKRSEKLASDVVDIENIHLKTEKEKYDFAINYVKSNYNWNTFNGKYASKSPDKLIDEKHGNCADINLFAIGLLNSLGIKAQPVIISTRDNGRIKHDYPYTNYFNYVLILANIDGNSILGDATEILSLNDRIPSRCINDRGLIVQKDKVEWIGLECMFPSEIKTDILIDNISNDNLNSSIIKTSTEYDALIFRNNYTDNIETVKKRIENNDYFIIDTSIIVQNQIDKENPYILKYIVTGKPETLNEKIYLSPFLNLTLADNPLKQKERTYPVDMTYPKLRIFNSTIVVPDGYKVEFIPSDQKIKNHLFELSYSTSTDENQLTISFNYWFKKSVYTPNDYLKLNFYFNEIIQKGNENIILSKVL